MSNVKHIVCPACNATNRIPTTKLSDEPSCGKCYGALFTGQPVELNATNFQQHVNRNDVPVVVDFWAPWCGPCKSMAPAFEQVSAELSPEVRLAKLNTEEEQTIAGHLNIRSIPTMVLFKNGREVTRKMGAMSAADIRSWVKNNI
ncbi:Thioredoxin [hydrothermal vent metagenome]|uniref:Thioredoxin n=1 Tax=hydrothermal vent metagenome TaxID=652676 RepID=A0A3B0WRX7_9ZZZZ